MACITASHNKTILRPNIQDYGYNYRKMSECAMQNKCLTPNIIYEATVTRLCETSFKERYHNHTRSIRLQSYSKDTELSKYVWELKNENKIPFIKWRILKKVMLKQDLIIVSWMENLYINNPIGDERLLNKKSEFVSKCRKQNKLLIKSVLLKDSMD